MEKDGKTISCNKVNSNNNLKFVNLSKETIKNKHSLFIRNIEIKPTTIKFSPYYQSNENYEINKQTFHSEKSKQPSIYLEVKKRSSCVLPNDLITNSTNLTKEMSLKKTSIKPLSNREFHTQSNFFKRDFKLKPPIKLNTLENKKVSKLKIYYLHKKDFYSKYNSNSKLTIPVINPKANNENVIKNKQSVKIELLSKYKDMSLDDSIIEGGREFSIISYFSDISLGDQETMVSDNSSKIKIEKIKNHLRNTKEFFNMIKLID